MKAGWIPSWLQRFEKEAGYTIKEETMSKQRIKELIDLVVTLVKKLLDMFMKKEK